MTTQKKMAILTGDHVMIVSFQRWGVFVVPTVEVAYRFRQRRPNLLVEVPFLLQEWVLGYLRSDPNHGLFRSKKGMIPSYIYGIIISHYKDPY